LKLRCESWALLPYDSCARKYGPKTRPLPTSRAAGPLVTRHSSLLERQLDKLVRAFLPIELAAGGDHRFELRGRDRQARRDAVNAAHQPVEVPDELAPGALPGVALAVPGVDREARAEQRHLVRGDDRHPLHEVQHLGRILGWI